MSLPCLAVQLKGPAQRPLLWAGKSSKKKKERKKERKKASKETKFFVAGKIYTRIT